MDLAILLLLLIPLAFLVVVMALAMRTTWRMGDETPGWTRVHRWLPIYRYPSKDRPVKLWPDSLDGQNDDGGSER